MDLYQPRKIKFKAWNKEARLLMRLNSIDCMKGELVKKNHILLQFTGLHDQQGEELYELDVVLLNGDQQLIFWNAEVNGWCLKKLTDTTVTQSLVKGLSDQCVRLWSYFESAQNG